jgi:hypothetical protein
MSAPMMSAAALKLIGHEGASQAPASRHAAQPHASFLDSWQAATICSSSAEGTIPASSQSIAEESLPLRSATLVRPGGNLRLSLYDLDLSKDEGRGDEPDDISRDVEARSGAGNPSARDLIVSSAPNDVGAIITRADLADPLQAEGAHPDVIDKASMTRPITSAEQWSGQVVAKVVRQETHLAPTPIIGTERADTELDSLPSVESISAKKPISALAVPKDDTERAQNLDLVSGDSGARSAAASEEPTPRPMLADGIGARRSVESGAGLPSGATGWHTSLVQGRPFTDRSSMPQYAVRVLELQISPDAHGVMNISMQKRSRQLYVRLEVNSPYATQQLESERGGLTARINGSGYEVTDLVIATAPGTEISQTSARTAVAGLSPGPEDAGAQQAGTSQHQGQPSERNAEGRERMHRSSERGGDTLPPPSQVSDARDRIFGARVIRKI